MRLKILKIIITCLFGALLLGLGHLQIVRGFYYRGLAVHNCIRIVPVEPNRGRIFDRNGIVLADTLVSFDIMVVSQEIQNKEKLFSFLSDVLKIKTKTLLDLYQKRKLASFAPVTIAEDISRNQAIILEENKFRFPGLLVEVRSKRSYPFGETGAHVLGYVGRISPERMEKFKNYGYTIEGMTGYSGLEEYYDTFLRGDEGGVQIEVNNRGQQVRLLGMRVAAPGHDLKTTLDARIQQIAQNLLAEERGVVIVMNMDNGEVLSMVSSPSFDPNVFLDYTASEKRGSYFTNSNAVLLNRAIRGQYPPGSVFKIPISIAALQTKKLNQRTSFLCNGSYVLGDRVFRCTHVHGLQDLTQAIAHSCNVYFYHTGLILGPKVVEEYAHLFGLGALTNIDLPYEEKGHVSHPDALTKRKWSKGDTLNFSIGQGDLLVTPIQLLKMMAVVARDGKDILPSIVQSIGSSQVRREGAMRNINISKFYFDQVKEGMRGAVVEEQGSAHALALNDMVVLGKTGTAQTSGGKLPHSWFVGFCPKAKTRIVFCVFLENGGSSYHACRMAADLLAEMKQQDIL
jgi:penicillin-binding protein 2